MWFKKITDIELQASLIALCKKVEAKNYLTHQDAEKYEALLFSIYERNLEPKMFLKIKPSKVK